MKGQHCNNAFWIHVIQTWIQNVAEYNCMRHTYSNRQFVSKPRLSFGVYKKTPRRLLSLYLTFLPPAAACSPASSPQMLSAGHLLYEVQEPSVVMVAMDSLVSIVETLPIFLEETRCWPRHQAPHTLGGVSSTLCWWTCWVLSLVQLWPPP